MPAFVNKSVGSFFGTSDELGTGSWPRAAKKSTKLRRIAAAPRGPLEGVERSAIRVAGVAAAGGHAAEVQREVVRVRRRGDRDLVRHELALDQLGERLVERDHPI